MTETQENTIQEESSEVLESHDTESTSDIDVDWEVRATELDDESKKFQSMYDRAQSKLERLEKAEPVINLLEQRPDLVETLQKAIVGEGENVKETITEDEFNPWDAYYKPDSPSYSMRVNESRKMVGEAVNEQMRTFQTQQAVSNLRGDLKNNHGMSDGDVKEFLGFYSTPKDQMSIDVLVDVWKKNGGKVSDSPLDAVRNNKAQPASAGSMRSANPRSKSAEDKLWESIKASDRTRIL